MIELKLQDVIADIDRFPWNSWVFLEGSDKITRSSPCLVIDTSTAEMSGDGCTPVQAKERNMSRFLYVEEIRSVLRALKQTTDAPSIELMCKAAVYYYQNYGFLPPENGARDGDLPPDA